MKRISKLSIKKRTKY